MLKKVDSEIQNIVSNEGKQNNDYRKNKGITLVALVITIIILIILATVAINFAFGNNGLITQAERARDMAANSTVQEQTAMNSMVDELANVMGDNGGSGDNTTEDGVPIPDGFYYVGGSKEEGVVISDNPADENRGTDHEVAQTLDGNQFVWIPVEDDSAFQRYSGYVNGSNQNSDLTTRYTEPYAHGYANEQSEYDAMKASVLANDGFYVGRYEAGTTNSARSSSSGITDSVVIKQGKYVYNYVGWSNSDDMTNELGGAVELSKNFDTVNGYTSVTSTLIYGVQWDAIMNFIDPAYATGSCTENSFVRDSTGKGWYDQSAPTTTGSNENYAVKNIYDLGGNVCEWTMEAYNTGIRVIRGRYVQRFRLGCSGFRSFQPQSFGQLRQLRFQVSFVFVGLKADRRCRKVE